MKQYATYLRVSTQRQGARGLGIAAQRSMCQSFVSQNGGEIVQEFMDIESGTHRDRKGLWEAIDYCKKNDCSLVIAKLDRLARDVEFTFKVINTGIDIHFTDMPVVNSMILGVFAAVAQYEREMVSTRTKQALAVRKAQGYALGGANETYRKNYDMKSKEEKLKIGMRRGYTRNKRYLASREVVTFMKVLRSTFPEACPSEDTSEWRWKDINTKGGDKYRALQLMRDYHELDDTLFKGWDFSNLKDVKLQVKLASRINQLRTSLRLAADFESKCHYLAHEDVCESA